MTRHSNFHQIAIGCGCALLTLSFVLGAGEVSGRTPAGLVLHLQNQTSGAGSSSSALSRRPFRKKKVRTPAGRVVVPVRIRHNVFTGSLVPAAGTPAPPSGPVKLHCGDTYISGNEQCDDGNALGNDGCSSTCMIETGFNCNGAQPTRCLSVCGDGVVATNEKCDDANTLDGDGCDSKCKVEFASVCNGSPSVCVGICGNGLLQAGEECDDGNTKSGDGCSSACKKE